MTTDVKTNGKAKVNRIGLTQQEYHGNPSTLCPGCGHIIHVYDPCRCSSGPGAS